MIWTMDARSAGQPVDTYLLGVCSSAGVSISMYDALIDDDVGPSFRLCPAVRALMWAGKWSASFCRRSRKKGDVAKITSDTL